MEYKLDTKKPHTAILIKLISLASIGATLFTPGIPQMMQFFQVSQNEIQFTLTLFLIGNRFGRKPTIYSGLLIAILGSLFSALSGVFDSFLMLILSRFVTAVGASVGLVLTMTIVNDYYYGHQARKVIPTISTAFAIIPFLGVVIGGFLVHHFGWDSTFYFLIFYYLTVFLTSTRLPETGKDLRRDATHLPVILKGYLQAFRDRQLVLFSTLFGLSTSMVYIFAATGPLIAIRIMKVSAQTYGIYNLINAAFYLIGNLFAARFTKKISAFGMIRLGLSIFGTASVVLFILLALQVNHPLALFIPFAFIFLGIPIAFASTIVLASGHYEDRANGSAVMNFINMGTAVIATLIVQNLPGDITFSMPLTLVIFSAVYYALFHYSKKFVKCAH